MGYEMPIVCKEVYLPIEIIVDEDISLDDYEKKYGFDLRSILALPDKAIEVKFKPNIKYFVNTGVPFSASAPVVYIPCVNIENYYSEGSTDAETIIGYYDPIDSAMCGIKLSIDKDAEFTFDNIKIRPYMV